MSELKFKVLDICKQIKTVKVKWFQKLSVIGCTPTISYINKIDGINIKSFEFSKHSSFWRTLLTED